MVGRTSTPPKVNSTSEYPVEARSPLFDILETSRFEENYVHYAANRISRDNEISKLTIPWEWILVSIDQRPVP